MTVSAGYIRTADVLGALSLAADLAIGLPEEHVLRSCYIGMRLAEEMAIPATEQVDLYYAELLMDAGCTAWTSQLAMFLLGDETIARQQFFYFTDASNPLAILSWLREYVAVGAPAPQRAKQLVEFMAHGRSMVREGFRNTCEVAQRFADRLGMSAGVQRALLAVFEQWDGSGPLGARGAAIPRVSRIVYASSFFEVFHRVGGPAAALRLARQKRATAFDPEVADAFLRLAESDVFWTDLQEESVWAIVKAMEPASDHQVLPEDRLDQVALAFADFADLKYPDALGHSRRVADLAERVARRMALSRRDVATIRLAGLMHDVGLVAVPSATLAKPREHLTQADWERMRLHPYHAQRILARVPALAETIPLVAAHHERYDGGGYPQGTPSATLPIGARILAVVDRFDELSRGSGAGITVEAALAEVVADAGRGLCPDVCRALAGELGSANGVAVVQSAAPVAPTWPAGLTDREVEILRLLARGYSRRRIASELVLSEHTVRHHLEHIYDKVGVSTRVAAALFAVEHHLLD